MFLHKFTRGAMTESYGLHASVLERVQKKRREVQETAVYKVPAR